MSSVGRLTNNKGALVTKCWLFFFFYISIYISIGYFSHRFIYTNDLFFNPWNRQLVSEHIKAVLFRQKGLEWAGYLLIPVIVFLKIQLPASCLYMNSVFNDRHIKLKKCFAIALQAEIVWLIPAVLKFGWFLFFPPEKLEVMSDFSPWSMSFLANNETPSYIKYLFQTFNAFELLYWVVLAEGIRSALTISFKKSLLIVAKSYGIGLLIWIALICFLLS